MVSTAPHGTGRGTSHRIRRCSLKTKEARGEGGPGTPPLPSKPGRPAPSRPDCRCAHEQRRLPGSPRAKLSNSPLWARGLPGAGRALVPPGEQDTVAARGYPPTLRFRGSGRKCERAPSSLNICLFSLHPSRKEDWEKQPAARWPCPRAAGTDMGRLQVFAFSFLGNSEERGHGVCV